MTANRKQTYIFFGPSTALYSASPENTIHLFNKPNMVVVDTNAGLMLAARHMAAVQAEH